MFLKTSPVRYFRPSLRAAVFETKVISLMRSFTNKLTGKLIFLWPMDHLVVMGS